MTPPSSHLTLAPLTTLLWLLMAAMELLAAEVQQARSPNAELLARYFRAETERLATRCLSEIKTLDDWNAARQTYREQLLEMLGLSPLPARTDLNASVTGKLEHKEFTVEKLHFQSMPGLYVTANLYLPKTSPQPAPAILYLCGHAVVVTNGISFGNKTAYQHHGIWFARNGYACLLIDTVQLGEIQGIHHGTHRENMWWWNARGYTPAGVEAWNAIRAIDYLQSRPEVDPARIGVTGRSGGGAYSWTTVALDDRVRAAAPVAGITDLQNHVVDGAVEGHCDCMFFVNTYGWDYPLLAALSAPRPLLICNSDKDWIFPLDGVVRLHSKVKKIYELHNATNKLGLLITEGPHKDTQDLQVPVFRWFNRHLKGEDPIIELAATKLFTPQQLRVFEQLPADERTSKIHESFVSTASAPESPQNAEEWAQQRDRWKRLLMEKVFRNWPPAPQTARAAVKVFEPAERSGMTLQIIELESQLHVPLRLYTLKESRREKSERLILEVLDSENWPAWLGAIRDTFGLELTNECLTTPPGTNARPRLDQLRAQAAEGVVLAWLSPRGIGLSKPSNNVRTQTHIRRRYMLLGQTLDEMRVWDIMTALNAVADLPKMRGLPITLKAENQMAVNALYASLFARPAHQLELNSLPESHRTGPDYLNVLRILDIPQTVAIVAEKSAIQLMTRQPEAWAYPRLIQTQLDWPKERLRILPAE
jgi:dienelactone hydrolase